MKPITNWLLIKLWMWQDNNSENPVDFRWVFYQFYQGTNFLWFLSNFSGIPTKKRQRSAFCTHENDSIIAIPAIVLWIYYRNQSHKALFIWPELSRAVIPNCSWNARRCVGKRVIEKGSWSYKGKTYFQGFSSTKRQQLQ